MEKKYALLVGSNYDKSLVPEELLTAEGSAPPIRWELEGSINSIELLHSHLVKECGFDPDNIEVLSDDTPEKPTQSNVLRSFESFVTKARPEVLLCFYFIGHSCGSMDKHGIVTCDRKSIPASELTDIAKMVPSDCSLTILMDSCYSGGMIYHLPLQTMYKSRIPIICDDILPSTEQGVVLITAAGRDQISKQSRFAGKDGEKGKKLGLLTYCICNTVHVTSTNLQCIETCRYQMSLWEVQQVPCLFCSTDRCFLPCTFASSDVDFQVLEHQKYNSKKKGKTFLCAVCNHSFTFISSKRKKCQQHAATHEGVKLHDCFPSL